MVSCTVSLTLYVFILFAFSIFLQTFTSHETVGEGWLSLTPLYFFHLLYRHLDTIWVITGNGPPLYTVSNESRIGNLCFPSASYFYLFIYLFSLYLKLTFPSLQLKPINVN